MYEPEEDNSSEAIPATQPEFLLKLSFYCKSVLSNSFRNELAIRVRVLNSS
jgi:hypothetical protein